MRLLMLLTLLNLSGCIEVERPECRSLSKYELRQEAAE